MATSEELLDDLLSLVHAETNEAKAATALDLAVEGDADGLRLLLQEQRNRTVVNVNARNPATGRALLHEACAEGHLEIAKLLLEKTDADLMLRTMLVRRERERKKVGLLSGYDESSTCIYTCYLLPARVVARRSTSPSPTTTARSCSCC